MRCGGIVIVALAIGSSLLGTAAALAQETTGALIGVVRSQDGAPLPGVTVTLEDPSNGLRRKAVSAADGGYRFLALPPSRYTLETTVEGFRTHRQTLTVALGQTIKTDIELSLGTVSDAIEVTAEQAPVLDVTSTVVGMTVDLDELVERVPVKREVTQVALLAPGTVPGDTAFDERTPGQQVAVVGGASVAENLYVVNGLNITNFREMLGSTRVPFDFLEGVQVKTGGYEAEYGRSTGGVINMITRSGSNSLHAAATVYYLPEGLQGPEPDTDFAASSRGGLEALEGNLSVGGPVLENRLFYFLYAGYEDTDWLSYYATPSLKIPLADRFETSQPYWGAKIDWTPSAGHRLEGTYISDRTDVNFIRWEYELDSGSLGDPLGTGVEERGGDNYILKYSGMLGDRVLLSLQAGRNEFARSDRSDGDECPVALDRRSGRPVVIGCWAQVYRVAADDTREAYRADLDYIVGAHSLRAGIDYEHNVSDNDSDYSGGVGYQYFLNGPRYPQLPPDTELAWEVYFLWGGSFDTFSNAAYVQDSWTVSPRLTLNLGLRWERYDNRNGLGETFIEADDQYAPRLGVAWNPNGDGRSKVQASYGVYYLPIASNTNVKAAGAVYRTSGWYVLEEGINPDGSPVELGQELDYAVVLDGETPDPRELLADNFVPMSQQEVIVGYERQFGDAWTLGVRGVARRFDQVIEDFSIQHALEAVYGIELDEWVYRIGNPGSSMDGWYDLDGDGNLDRIHLSADALDYPEAERDYYALELIFDRRFGGSWMLQGSYVWSHVYGNYEGYTNSDIGQSDPGLTQTFDTPGLLDHASGDLPNDRRHTFKVFGTYSWPMGLQLGGNFFYRTGRAINSFGLHPTDADAQAYGPDSFFTGGEPRPRGCCGRTDEVWTLDALARYDFRVGDLDMNLRVDIFNVFDNDAVIEVDEIAEDATGVLSPTYRDIFAYQTPRRVRLGFGVSF